jgi:hypothetical protein
MFVGRALDVVNRRHVAATETSRGLSQGAMTAKAGNHGPKFDRGWFRSRQRAGGSQRPKRDRGMMRVSL